MDENRVIQKISLDVSRAGIPPRVFAKQGDNNLRIVAASLYDNGKAYTVPSGYKANIRAKKPDGKSIYNPAEEVTQNVVYITLTQQILAADGIVTADIEITDGSNTIKTERWQICVEAAACKDSDVESTDEAKTIRQLVADAEASKTAAANSAEEAKAAAGKAAEDAKKVIGEDVTEKLKNMQKIQQDVTDKATQVSTDAAKVEGYAKAAQYLIGYNDKNILTLFLYED